MNHHESGNQKSLVDISAPKKKKISPSPQIPQFTADTFPAPRPLPSWKARPTPLLEFSIKKPIPPPAHRTPPSPSQSRKKKIKNIRNVPQERHRKAFRKGPPGLIQVVLTVLVLWLRLLLMPDYRASCKSLGVCPWTRICFMARSSKFLDLPPLPPLPPVQKWDAQHVFLQHKEAHTEGIQCHTLQPNQ